MNATKSGLFGQSPLFPGEDLEEYKTLSASIAAAENPQDAIDEIFVEEVVNCVWRLRRVPRIEASVFFHHITDQIDREARAVTLGCAPVAAVLSGVFLRDAAGPNTIVKYTKYETALANRRDRALRELERRRVGRATRPASAPTEVPRKAGE